MLRAGRTAALLRQNSGGILSYAVNIHERSIRTPCFLQSHSKTAVLAHQPHAPYSSATAPLMQSFSDTATSTATADPIFSAPKIRSSNLKPDVERVPGPPPRVNVKNVAKLINEMVNKLRAAKIPMSERLEKLLTLKGKRKRRSSKSKQLYLLRLEERKKTMVRAISRTKLAEMSAEEISAAVEKPYSVKRVRLITDPHGVVHVGIKCWLGNNLRYVYAVGEKSIATIHQRNKPELVVQIPGLGIVTSDRVFMQGFSDASGKFNPLLAPNQISGLFMNFFLFPVHASSQTIDGGDSNAKRLLLRCGSALRVLVPGNFEKWYRTLSSKTATGRSHFPEKFIKENMQMYKLRRLLTASGEEEKKEMKLLDDYYASTLSGKSSKSSSSQIPLSVSWLARAKNLALPKKIPATSSFAKLETPFDLYKQICNYDYEVKIIASNDVLVTTDSNFLNVASEHQNEEASSSSSSSSSSTSSSSPSLPKRSFVFGIIPNNVMQIGVSAFVDVVSRDLYFKSVESKFDPVAPDWLLDYPYIWNISTSDLSDSWNVDKAVFVAYFKENDIGIPFRVNPFGIKYICPEFFMTRAPDDEYATIYIQNFGMIRNSPSGPLFMPGTTVLQQTSSSSEALPAITFVKAAESFSPCTFGHFINGNKFVLGNFGVFQMQESNIYGQLGVFVPGMFISELNKFIPASTPIVSNYGLFVNHVQNSANGVVKNTFIDHAFSTPPKPAADEGASVATSDPRFAGSLTDLQPIIGAEIRRMPYGRFDYQIMCGDGSILFSRLFSPSGDKYEFSNLSISMGMFHIEKIELDNSGHANILVQRLSDPSFVSRPGIEFYSFAPVEAHLFQRKMLIEQRRKEVTEVQASATANKLANQIAFDYFTLTGSPSGPLENATHLNPAVSSYAICPPQPADMDHTAFLEKIGRNMKDNADKFKDWNEMFTITSKGMKAKGLSVEARKYLMAWRRRYLFGEQPRPMRESPDKKNKKK